MDLSGFHRIDPIQWEVPRTAGMRVPVRIFADEDLLRDMDVLLREAGFDYQEEAIGGFGSIRLYVCAKQPEARSG